MSFTPHTYKLSGDIEIFFTDTGAPPNSSDYKTLIVLHGAAFNGHGFERLHEHAHSLNLRVVLWNRREYPGSTKYTDAELEEVAEGKKVFLDRLGQQMSEWLLQFIEKENIPPSTDQKTGGIAIVGWSLGCAWALTLFADPKVSSPEATRILEKYVKDVVLYDPPHLSLGYELNPERDFYNPWTDPDCKTPEETYRAFTHWVSSFFDHKSSDTGDFDDMDLTTKRSENPTIAQWTQEEFSKWVSPDAAARSELKLYVKPMQTRISEMAEAVFFDAKLIDSYFPDLKVTVIVCARTQWHSLWASLETMKRYKAHIADGKPARPTQLIKIDGINHYAHHETPKLLLEKIVEGTRAEL
ncbi:hypothetical protein AAF712_007357 [Marasmius tenuissimus]|uniref:AB hydrolase-1 domain-containing protein n=1 Tax=Marasmius tenuissimus TaxID=585030 RepID=A0ABR2ZWY0_9AGAR